LFTSLGWSSFNPSGSEKIPTVETMCSTYNEAMFVKYGITQVVSVSITLVNMIIRELNIFMIKKVGYHGLGNQTAAIFVAIFLASFANTALLLLLGNANTSEYRFIAWLPFNGIYYNLTQNWYIDIGPALTSAMVVNSVYIYIDIAIGVGMKFFFRCLDKGGACCCKKRPTSALTVQ
jgi:hypothetical protein